MSEKVKTKNNLIKIITKLVPCCGGHEFESKNTKTLKNAPSTAIKGVFNFHVV